MKNILKSIVTVLVSAIVLCCLAVSVGAEGKVTYSDSSDRFIFAPGSSHSPTDLFGDLKGVMPGDVIKQNVTVKNAASNKVKVKLYVRSLGAQKNTNDFLSKLHLTVAKSEINKMAYMFDASADVTDGMTEWVYLGTLYSGGEVNLVLNLEVPAQLGDEYQDAIGYIDWEFKAEEYPVDPDDPVSPSTGDNIGKYLLIAVAAIIIVFLPIVVLRKRKSEE